MTDLVQYYRKSDGNTKKKILSCIFEGKIHFAEKQDATISYTLRIQLLFNASKGLEGSKNKKEVENDLLSYVAPPAGLEPATLWLTVRCSNQLS